MTRDDSSVIDQTRHSAGICDWTPWEHKTGGHGEMLHNATGTRIPHATLRRATHCDPRLGDRGGQRASAKLVVTRGWGWGASQCKTH